MMRIDPTLSLIWRTPTSIQIGFPDAVVVTELTALEERLLVALRTGCNLEAYYGMGATLGASRTQCDTFADRISPSFEKTAARRARIGIDYVGSDGSGETATALANLLATVCDVRSVNAANVPHQRLAADHRIHSSKRTARGGCEGTSWQPDLVIVLAHFAITPARAGVWLRREIPHMAVIVGDRTTRIGPLVQAGRGPCLSCVEMLTCDADPTRTAMLAQLASRPCSGASPLVNAEIATVATRVVQAHMDLSRDDSLEPGEVLKLDASTGLWTNEKISMCSRCSCRALPENGTAAAA